MPATTKRADGAALKREGPVSGRTQAPPEPRDSQIQKLYTKNDDPAPAHAAGGTKAVRQPRAPGAAALPDIETFEDEGR